MLLCKKHAAPHSCSAFPNRSTTFLPEYMLIFPDGRGSNKNLKKMKRILLLTACLAGMVLTGCNVTRTITNQSEYYQKGDTSVVIQTRTVETYDASRKKLY